jgi:BirA family biotin operon repressor/biotin-[acetyl-CoA-carboxylase] ligase
MANEHVHLLERPFVKEMRDALTRRQLALFVLSIDRSSASGVKRFIAKPAELFDTCFGTHQRPSVCFPPKIEWIARIDCFDSIPVGMATPYSTQVREEVSSTQDLATAGFSGTPLLVVAARQTDGRGRSRRLWESAPRAIAASLAFKPDWPVAHWPVIPLIAGLSAAEVLSEAVSLKWPNDLLFGEGKVGGVLVEGSADHVVVGCGVNLWWPDPSPGAIGLFPNDPGEDRHVQLAHEWVQRFLERMSAAPDDWPRGDYLARCVTIGREITWEPVGSGTAIDVDAEGALVVETLSGAVRLVAGEVRHVRDARR